MIAASDLGSSKSSWCSLCALFPRFWASPCTGTVCCCAFSIIPFGSCELFTALLSFRFSSQETLTALLPWGCCCCFSGVHYPHILLFFSSGMLSLNTCFPYKLLIHSDFRGAFAFWGNWIGSMDSFLTVVSTLQNIILSQDCFESWTVYPAYRSSSYWLAWNMWCYLLDISGSCKTLDQWSGFL